MKIVKCLAVLATVYLSLMPVLAQETNTVTWETYSHMSKHNGDSLFFVIKLPRALNLGETVSVLTKKFGWIQLDMRAAGYDNTRSSFYLNLEWTGEVPSDIKMEIVPLTIDTGEISPEITNSQATKILYDIGNRSSVFRSLDGNSYLVPFYFSEPFQATDTLLYSPAPVSVAAVPRENLMYWRNKGVLLFTNDPSRLRFSVDSFATVDPALESATAKLATPNLLPRIRARYHSSNHTAFVLSSPIPEDQSLIVSVGSGKRKQSFSIPIESVHVSTNGQPIVILDRSLVKGLAVKFSTLISAETDLPPTLVSTERPMCEEYVSGSGCFVAIKATVPVTMGFYFEPTPVPGAYSPVGASFADKTGSYIVMGKKHFTLTGIK